MEKLIHDELSLVDRGSTAAIGMLVFPSLDTILELYFSISVIRLSDLYVQLAKGHETFQLICVREIIAAKLKAFCDYRNVLKKKIKDQIGIIQDH